MRKYLFVLIVLAVMGLVAPVSAAYYLGGEFNGWTADGDVMTDNLDGTHSATLSGLAVDSRYAFKVTDGTWDVAYPPANSWLFTDDSGNITITFDTNLVTDGWQTDQYRIALNTDPGSWTIVGTFGGSAEWNNVAPEMVMTSLGGGIYRLTKTLSAGTYAWKATVTGSWDAVGADGRSENAGNMEGLTATEGEVVNFYVDALAGTVVSGLEPVSIPHDPTPASGESDVLVSGLELSWSVSQDTSGAVNPNLVSHKLYMSDGSTTDPNLVFVDTVVGWDAGTLRASYTPSPELIKDGRYLWRVDMVDDVNEIEGAVWTFYTEVTVPVIDSITPYQVVDATATAAFTVVVTSASPESYQWYKDDGDGVANPSDTELTGETTDTLTITGATLTDEGFYYCAVSNDSLVEVASDQVPLAIKDRIAYWDFESGDPNSKVAGSPASFLYGDPAFVTTGILGDAMEFDNDTGAEDILYTDPDQASYFDICNYSMTVACWIQSSSAFTWGPMVARNGEDGEGWQLRHNGDTLDRISFTTQGTGNDVGTASNRTVYDGNWHYVVATYDGIIKKVYIDGVASLLYSSDDGSIAQESDAVGGPISSTLSPVALAGRVTGNLIDGLVFEDVTACVLDEVEIYNYALDAAKIAQTFADITNTPVCPAPQQYDLDDDCIVNLVDLGLLASKWLNDISVQPAP